MSVLVVPIRLDALMLTAAEAVVGPDLDVTRLPWSDGLRDHNGDTPNLASAADAEPFSPRSLRLSPGVHLHWALPDGLTRGSMRPRPWATERVDRLHLPPAPNRWLVLRQRAGAKPRAWLVESDYLHPFDEVTATQDDAEGLPVAYPLDRVTGAQAGFARIGRVTELANEPRAPDPADRFLPGLGLTLTALGHGDPAFAALYANCRGVFAMRDADLPSQATEYEVFGWYDGGAPDPLEGVATWLDAQDDATLIGRLNARDGASPLKAGATLSGAQRAAARRLLLGDALGWLAPEDDGGSGPPRRLLCHGRLRLDPSDPGVELPSGGLTTPVAVGHSGSEALAAMLAALTAPEGSDAARERIEASIEALRLGPKLRDHPLDIGPKFAEARHEAQFRSAGRRNLWSLRPAPGAADDAPAPEGVARPLHSLNVAQDAYDTATAEIDSLRETLWLDWSRWMVARHPRNDHAGIVVDVNALAVLIERGCAALEAGLARRGALMVRLRDGRWIAKAGRGDNSSLAEALVQRLAELVDTVDADARGLTVARVPGPRFWRAADPVVLLAHPLARPSLRHGQDGATHHSGLLACAVMPLDVQRMKPSRMMALELAAMARRFLHEAPDIARQGRRSWNPFLMEWAALTEPEADGGAHEAHRIGYAPDFISRNYQLPEDGCDLALRPEAAASGHRVAASGRALLSAHSAGALRGRIEAWLDGATGPAARLAVARFTRQGEPGALAVAIGRFWSREAGPAGADRATAEASAAGAATETTDVALETLLDAQRAMELLGGAALSQTLGGFGDALAGRRRSLRRPIADPTGFEPEQRLTARVAAVLGEAGDAEALPGVAFAPLRSGAFAIERLRLIDTFGQRLDWTPHRVHAAQTMRTVSADRIGLAPRLTQPARLAAQWISAGDDSVEINDDPATSPICGWLSVSHLERGEVALHEAGGRLLGSMDPGGAWRPAPGALQAPEGPAQIEHPRLAAVLRWMLSRADRQGFMQALSATLDAALDAINPADADDDAARALLTGRPIAVVRCSVALRLLGLPRVSPEWTDLIARINGAPPGDHGLAQVRVAVRVGEHGQFGDGVLGYWLDSEQPDAMKPFRGGKLWLPQPSGGAPDHPDLVKIEDHDGHPTGLSVAAADPPVMLTMLIDPRATAHFTTGVLPTKALRLPASHYRETMGRIGVSLLAAPLLTPAGRLELPTPAIAGGGWAWVERAPGGWRETPAAAHVTRPALAAALPDAAESLWARLIAAGWLEQGPIEDIAWLGRVAEGATSLPGETAASSSRILATLHAVAEGATPPSPRARFDARIEAREGWLQFRPDATPTD